MLDKKKAFEDITLIIGLQGLCNQFVLEHKKQFIQWMEDKVK